MAQDPELVDKKKLLFVCSGNTCRSPMAMIVAMNQLGDKAECDSAAGKIEFGDFKSGKSAAAKGKTAIKTKYGEESIEYKCISVYVPKPLSVDLVRWATDVLFLGETFMENAKAKIPKEYHHKMKYYATYDSQGKPMHDVPDPFDGDWWPEYYKLAKPKEKKQESYDKVLESMHNDFQPQLTKILWP